MKKNWSIILILLLCLYKGINALVESASENSRNSSSLQDNTRSSKEVKLFDRIASAIFGTNHDVDEKSPVKKRHPLLKNKNVVYSGGNHHPPAVAPRPPPPLRQQHPSKSSQTKLYNKVGGFPQSDLYDIQNINNNQPNSNRVIGNANGNNLERWQIAQPASMAQIKDLQVQCEKDLMRVRVIFDRPFNGMIFSKGYYSNRNCVHTPAGLGQTTVTFDISLRSCGMVSSVNSDYSSPQGQYIENTIIIQYDPQLQEVWDQARKLRCTWYDFYEKSVTFKPYQVNHLDPVTANFLGDNLRCWMQIQVGKGPHASEVSGIVKIGQTMTMVLGIKDDENKFDMMIRNCVAHDGIRSPITLVDEKGCVARPKIMSPFKKIQNFDVTANVLAYAYFQAFKFPDSMNVHFQCVVQVCRGSCPAPDCGGPKKNFYSEDSYGPPLGQPLSHIGSNGVISPRVNRKYFAPNETSTIQKRIDEEGVSSADKSRSKRSSKSEEEEEVVDVETTKIIRVVAPSDVQFNLSPDSDDDRSKEEIVISNNMSESTLLSSSDMTCVNTAAFVASTIAFLMILIIALITIVFLWMRVRSLTRSKASKIVVH